LEDVLQELTAQRKRHDEELADVKKELADLKKERSPTRETRVEKELRDLKEELRKERKQERKERKQIGVALERLSDELGAAARTVLEVRSLVAPLTVPE
jgi:septal ring factor EnvC (AmiA/AmiB activator)